MLKNKKQYITFIMSSPKKKKKKEKREGPEHDSNSRLLNAIPCATPLRKVKFYYFNVDMQ